MADTEFNIDDLLNADTRSKDGVYYLWLAVFISSFLVLKNGKEGAGPARSFLFGDNPFFDFVADGLGYEPEALRERIGKALEKVKSEQPPFAGHP